MKLDELTNRVRVRGKVSEPVLSAYWNRISDPGGNGWDSTTDFFIQELKKLGWVPAGEGQLSEIYINPKKSYILKINKTPDAAYEHFTRITKQFPNKHFPKIGDKKSIMVHNEKYYVYVIEKLYPLNQERAEELADQFSDLVCFYWVDGGMDDPDNDGWPKQFPDDSKNYFKANPSLLKALKILADQSKRFEEDIHSGNIMQRKDGTIVIIDPYV